MTTNQELLDQMNLYQKADLALADFTTGGRLNPAVAQQFMELLLSPTKLMPLSHVKPMDSWSERIDKIEFSGYILRPGVENESLPIADRVKPTITSTTVSTEEFIAEARMSYSTLEDSIERGNFQDRMLSLVSKRVAYDMEYTVVNANKTTGTGALKLFDGIRALATSHPANIGGNPLDEDQVLKIVKEMDNRYQQDPATLKIFTSPKAVLDYAHRTYVSRGTTLGDNALQRPLVYPYIGRELVDVPAFPENLGGGFNETEAIYCDPKNIVVGVWREISIETQKDITARQLIIVATLRFGVNFAHEDAVVRGYGITIS